MPINVHGAKHMLPAPEEPEFRKWTRELFSDSQLVSETLMFARLTDNPDCVKSVLCDFAFKPKELFRDECVIRLADLSPKSVKDYQDFVSPLPGLCRCQPGLFHGLPGRCQRLPCFRTRNPIAPENLIFSGTSFPRAIKKPRNPHECRLQDSSCTARGSNPGHPD